MSFINIFDDYCILREFIDENNLLIIVYCGKNNKFFQKILSVNEWTAMVSNFTIEELEIIFKVCIDRKQGYNLKIIENDIDLLLQFNCEELIKTYSWCIKLVEKCTGSIQKVNEIFKNLRIRFSSNNLPNYSTITEYNSDDLITLNDETIDNTSLNDESFAQSFQNIYQKEKINNFLNDLESSIKQLIIFQNKELQMVPFIAKIHEKKTDFLKYVKISNVQQKSIFTKKYITDNMNYATEEENDIISDECESKQRKNNPKFSRIRSESDSDSNSDECESKQRKNNPKFSRIRSESDSEDNQSETSDGSDSESEFESPINKKYSTNTKTSNTKKNVSVKNKQKINKK